MNKTSERKTMTTLTTLATRGVFVLLPVLLCASCSTSKVWVTAQDVAGLASSSPPPISMRVGLFIPEDLKNFNWAEPFGRGRSEWLAGVEIQAMIEQAARRMFREIVPVTAAETAKDFQAKNLDALVSVGFITVTEVPLAGSRLVGERLYKVDVGGQWDVSSPDGKRLFFTKPSGHAETKMPFPMGPTTARELLKKTFVVAFNDYFGKVTAEITASGWWKDTSWRNK